MSGARSTTISAKLEQLLVQQSASLHSRKAPVSPATWVPASVCPAHAAHLLSQPVQNRYHVLWVAPCFMADPNFSTSKSAKDTMPPAHDSNMPMQDDTSDGSEDGEVMYLLNAAFLHETSLFTLLLCQPLPSSLLSPLSRLSERFPAMLDEFSASHTAAALPSRTNHICMRHGHWKVCAQGSQGETWLAAATPALNVQLSFSSFGSQTRSSLARESESSTQLLPPVRHCSGAGCLASGDYLENLIWPTECSSDARPGIAADSVWVDVATVKKYSLGVYADAIWVPFHPSCGFAPWWRMHLLRMGRLRPSPAAANDGFHAPRARSSLGLHHHTSESATYKSWLGELYVHPLE